jgi:hypothetical protein
MYNIVCIGRNKSASTTKVLIRENYFSVTLSEVYYILIEKEVVGQ